MSDDEPLSDFSEEEFPSDVDSDMEEEKTEMNESDRTAAMDKLIPALDPSDYGKMPASFYSNSQRTAPSNDNAHDADAESEEARSKEGSSTVKDNSKGQLLQRPIRRPILPRDNFDGVDSDDETDSEEEVGAGLPDDGEDSDEDRPQVVGDVEVDMGAEEEEFLEFARQSLGLDDKMWAQFIDERNDRGGTSPSTHHERYLRILSSHYY